MMIGAFGVPIVAIVSTYWYKISKMRSDNALKERMIEQGMSAEEVERVINSGNNTEE